MTTIEDMPRLRRAAQDLYCASVTLRIIDQPEISERVARIIGELEGIAARLTREEGK